MTTGHTELREWLHLIRGEFTEIPDLRLTQTQVEKLWGLEPTTAQAILGALVDVGFLRKTRQGAYLRAGPA